jgi:hypothetical protein
VIPEYACALEKAMGPDGMEQLQSQVSKAIGYFNRDARRLYEGLPVRPGRKTAIRRR